MKIVALGNDSDRDRDSSEWPCQLSFEGDMTIYTVEKIHQDLNDHLEKNNSFHLKLDKVEEIDTAGLQILLAIQRHTESNRGSLKLANPSESVTGALNLFHLTERFEIATT